MVVVYLVVASMSNLAPLASRVIRWASAWNRPVLISVMMVSLVWTWRRQGQRLWVSVCTLVHRHALCPHPATLITEWAVYMLQQCCKEDAHPIVLVSCS